jgi:DNA-binding GntR family transcriptional regulator
LSNRAGDQAGEFNPTSRQFGLPLPEQIAEVLATEIIKRELTPGSRLPELALAERFGTSRAPIREALYLLDQAGLVERTPRCGTVVKAYTRREIEEIYQVRITLERLAVERICVRGAWGVTFGRRLARSPTAGLVED